ncbi:transcription initiation factor IIB [ANME-1 cluster archaeon AG-394-G21]|nr:transcription initiation factor IIB [ANME-1 cluster archaeon AG-394-G21]
MDEQIRKCLECGSKSIVTDPKHAELYCADCGVVITENIVDLGPEWRSYDAEQASKRVRTGPPMSYRVHNKGLSTPMPGSLTRSKRLRGLIAMDSNEKSLSFALGEIDRMACALNLPGDLRETTSLLYRKAAKRSLIKGRSIEELASAMLYITCRQYGIPRTLKEIAAVSRVPLKKIRRAYIFLLHKLEIKLAPADPACYIPRFCSELGLRDVIRERAIEIVSEDKETIAAKGWTPTGTAAAAIYLASLLSGESVEVKDMAKVAGTTPVTIQNRYKELASKSKLNTLSSHALQKGESFVAATV